MHNRSKKEILYFTFLFLLFVLMANPHYFSRRLDVSENTALLISGGIFTIVSVFVYFLAKVGCDQDKEGFWTPSVFSQCSGGEYMHQGSSENAKMCHEMAKTPEGLAGIASYQCATGQIGMPSYPFVYSELSDPNWKNDRCTQGECNPVYGGVPCASTKNLIN